MTLPQLGDPEAFGRRRASYMPSPRHAGFGPAFTLP
jgi:hypothetical protein